jgi:chemotaxis protein MotB
MSADDLRPTIVVKRIKKVAGGHHGGAWKIAYADFVTAMMAFFLLMWLLGSVDGGTLNGISEYFKTPMKVALQGGSKSGDSKVVIQGGGLDITSKDGQTARSDAPPGENEKQNEEKKFESLTESQKKAAIKLQKADEQAKLKVMREKLQNQINNSPRLKKYNAQLKIDITDEGLRVLITDEANRPMFGTASAEMQPYAQEIIKAMAPTFNEMPNTISISGHTDATPYSSGNGSYSNWELSADRANAARRVLIAGGLRQDHLIRVTGLADAVLLDSTNPLNPINRRISIILMNKAAEQAIRNEGKLKTTTLDLENNSYDLNKTVSPMDVQKPPIPDIKPNIKPELAPTPAPIEKSEIEPVAPPPLKVATSNPIPQKTPEQVKADNKQNFQPIPKLQIIQLEKPIPSKN